MKTLISIVAVVLLGFLTVQGGWLNKDFKNNTGQEANNIEIILTGTPTITSHYDNNWVPAGFVVGVFNFTKTTTTWNGQSATVLKWYGVTVPPGGLVHIGFGTPNAMDTILSACWTKDSVAIGPIVQVQVWEWAQGGITLLNNLYNCDTLPRNQGLHVGQVAVEYYTDAQPLANLNDFTPRQPIRRDTCDCWDHIALQAGDEQTLTCVDPPPEAQFMVWRFTLDTDPSLASPNRVREFVQFPIDHEVPTMTEVGIIVLFVLLAGTAMWIIWKRRRVRMAA